VAGFLARLAGVEDEGNLLGLPSQYAMPGDVRRERDRAVGRSIARSQVIAADVQGIEHIGGLALGATARISTLAEQVAIANPHERARTDGVADVVAATLARKVAELGGL
jgi:hypothetical protein